MGTSRLDRRLAASLRLLPASFRCFRYYDSNTLADPGLRYTYIPVRTDSDVLAHALGQVC